MFLINYSICQPLISSTGAAKSSITSTELSFCLHCPFNTRIVLLALNTQFVSLVCGSVCQLHLASCILLDRHRFPSKNYG